MLFWDGDGKGRLADCDRRNEVGRASAPGGGGAVEAKCGLDSEAAGQHGKCDAIGVLSKKKI